MPIRPVRYMKSRLATSLLLHPQTREDRNTVMLYLSTAMVGVPNGGILSFMSVFLARLGAGETELGWLSSAPALLMIFLLLPGAAIAERFANQVRVRNISLYVFRIGFLLCAIAPFFVPARLLPTLLIIVWASRMLPNAVAMPAWTTVLSQAVSPRRRARLNGTRWALLSLVSAVSSAVFGGMLDAIVFPLNYQIVFLISFLVGVLDPFFFRGIEVPDIDVPPKAARKPWLRGMREYLAPVMSNRLFLRTLAATMLYRIALELPAPLFSLFWVNHLQASDTLIGLRGTVGSIALMVGYMAWGRAAEKLGDRRMLWLAALGLAAYPMMTAFLPSAVWILVAAVLWGITASGIDVALFDVMLGALPPQRTPLFSAVWSMAGNAAAFVGPLLGAVLSQRTSPGTALLIAGIAQIVVTLPFWALPGAPEPDAPAAQP